MAALRRNRRTDAGIAGDMTQAFAVPRQVEARITLS
jgi:hypothetical protein